MYIAMEFCETPDGGVAASHDSLVYSTWYRVTQTNMFAWIIRSSSVDTKLYTTALYMEWYNSRVYFANPPWRWRCRKTPLIISHEITYEKSLSCELNWKIKVWLAVCSLCPVLVPGHSRRGLHLLNYWVYVPLNCLLCNSMPILVPENWLMAGPQFSITSNTYTQLSTNFKFL